MSDLIIIAVLATVYFFPTVIAALGHKRNCAAIFVLNLFLGWTLIGWVMALVWSCMAEGQAHVQADI